jgi:hypothetical protein
MLLRYEKDLRTVSLNVETLAASIAELTAIPQHGSASSNPTVVSQMRSAMAAGHDALN